MSSPRPIRVLVVDDSAFMRKKLSEVFAAQPDMQVVGIARDGEDALAVLSRLAANSTDGGASVDVVTVDVEMPRLDGLGLVRRLMAERPLPIVMVSSITEANAAVTLEALALGAVDFVTKPGGSISLGFDAVADEMCGKVRAAARARLRGSRLGRARSAAVPQVVPSPGEPQGEGLATLQRPARRVIGIASSTGGPGALLEIVPRLNLPREMALVIVQHMPAGFTRSLAARLNQLSPFPVREAQDGDLLAGGTAWVAPGGYHVVLDRMGRLRLDESPPRHGVRPAADVTFEAIARRFGRSAIAVVLTGMGVDGAAGAGAIRAAGGRVIAEAESTCVVFGMPKAALESGAAERAVPLPDIPNHIQEMSVHVR